MSEDTTDAAETSEAQAERMLEAALGGRTLHQALLDASREEDARVDERAAANARNRERAERLLAFLEKKPD